MDDRPPQEQDHSYPRSFFWPLVLVGVGIIWLLSNLGILSLDSLWSLVRLWPVLLIAIGVDLLLGRRRPWVGVLIGVLILGLVGWLLVAAPGLGMPSADRPQLETTHLSEPIGNATSAKLELDLAEMPTMVRALSDSTDLIDAALAHRGQIEFQVSGEREKVVTLEPVRSLGLPWIGLLPWEEGRWEIGLTPDLPLEVEVTGGSGAAQLDLARLQITSLRLDITSGNVRASLPATEKRYQVLVEGGSGSLDLMLSEESQIEMELNVHSGATDLLVGQGSSLNVQIDGGSGRLLIDVPDDAATRFTVSAGGSGTVTLPNDLRQVSDGQDNDDDTGTWETPDFSSAGVKVEITVDLGSGRVIVR